VKSANPIRVIIQAFPECGRWDEAPDLLELIEEYEEKGFDVIVIDGCPDCYQTSFSVPEKCVYR